MTTTEQIAAYEADRRAAVGRLARAQTEYERKLAWDAITWLDAQIRRLVLTPASAARMRL